MSGRAAVFLDRDGVLNALVPDVLSGKPESPLRVQDVELLAGVPSALRELAGTGFLLVGVSNQPGVAKGRVTREQLDAVQARVLALLAAEGVELDDFRLCLHHPEGSSAELGIACECRKPAPGMLLDAGADLGIDLKRSWMIGDTDADVAAGLAAGTMTVLIEHPASGHKRSGAHAPTALADDLPHAVRSILDGSGS